MYIKLKLNLDKKGEKTLLRNTYSKQKSVLIPLKAGCLKRNFLYETIEHTRGIRSTTIEADINQELTPLELNKSFQKKLPKS